MSATFLVENSEVSSRYWYERTMDGLEVACRQFIYDTYATCVIFDTRKSLILALATLYAKKYVIIRGILCKSYQVWMKWLLHLSSGIGVVLLTRQVSRSRMFVTCKKEYKPLVPFRPAILDLFDILFSKKEQSTLFGARFWCTPLFLQMVF